MRGLKVLIVDDQASNRKLLADLVTHEGCDAVVASGGAEALAILAREPFDLLLLDIMMPEVDGIAVLARLKEQRLLPGLSVVVVTAHEDRKMRVDALTAGAFDFLTKPIDRLEVICRIRTLVELKRLRESAVNAVEEALRQSERRLRLRFEQSPVAKIDWDREFRVTAWNPAAERLFGYSRAEALGRRATFIVPESARSRVDDVWRELVAGAANESTNHNLAKDGRTLVCEWHNAPLRSADGTLLGASSVVLDVTERVRLQEELAQSRKMDAIGKLAGGIAHDFNNILALILSYATFIHDALPAGDLRRNDSLEVLRAAERGSGLTKQLLTFSRLGPTTKQPTDLNERIAQLHNLLSRTVGEHIELNVVPSARPAVVLIDPVQFDQIVLNLAVNARDAMPNGGRLRIVLDHPPEFAPEGNELGVVRLTVSDTGTGMDAHTQQHAFEPFFTTKDQGKGTGLGLATCFGIVQDARGSLRLHSVLGEGSTFVVELPLSAESPGVCKPNRAEPRPGRGEMVLVVEDEPALRNVAVRALEGAGYTVQVASDGKDALRRIDELRSRLDLILTDVVMPGCSGYDVVAHAASVSPTTAFVLTSGYFDESVRDNRREGVPILWKPLLPHEMVRAVAETLAANRAANGIRSVPVASVAPDEVLIVEDDRPMRQALARVLAGAGYATKMAATLAEARTLLESGPEPSLMLCDLTLPDGSGAELLLWLQSARPALCRRTVILTGGACDEAARRLVDGGEFRVLPKPTEPKLLLRVLSETRQEAAVGLPPRAIGDPWKPATRSTNAGQARQERVLFVEDDVSFASAVQRVLGGGGFEVSVAGTLAAASSILAKGGLDALVLDVGLPDGNGFDLLNELHGDNAELPIVLVTGAPTVETASRAVRSRVYEYLPKPFPPSELLRVVRGAVSAGRIARLRTKLLAARFGGDEFVANLSETERVFGLALSKIRMVFQPIVRSCDGSIFGYEALLRCDEPGFDSPLRLLAAAEVLGRVPDVGRAVRASVAATMRAHPHGLAAIFVNIHPAELRADLLSEAIDPLMAMAHRVVLEITERACLETGPTLDQELARLRALGYRIAVDDLGEGYAGLSSLVALRPEIVKIDMSLVRDVHRAPLKRDIVGALVDMARRSGIAVVAEGVETDDERRALVDLGCDLLQGYLLGRPGAPFPVARAGWGTNT